ncbi:MAG: hypothetical protein R3D98_15835 [Candidatus Krumholzibacteriia bacterium]
MSQIRIAVLYLAILATSVLFASDVAPRPEARPLTPQQQELATLLEARAATLETLRAQLAAATDQATALATLRTIEDHKSGTEVEILRLQKRHAERAGDLAAVAALEVAIERLLTTPAPVGTEAAREASRQRRAGGRTHD